LPVFIVCGLKTGKKISDVDKIAKYTQIRTEKEISSFRKNLINQDWSKVFLEEVNNAYDVFLNLFVTLYNKICHSKRGKVNKKKTTTWITSGLQKACKKKNKLYRDFIKYKSSNHEIKFKRYKNKLITIM